LAYKQTISRNLQAEDIITAEPAKLLGKLDLGKRLSIDLRGLVYAAVLDLPD
jgi:hypothetical protein